ncbi:type IV secretory system conjugative DNA transfer family protein [Martelella lutilitoris]|uniref:Type IV secretory system conjugative DNA transfer family protein n=1 Tax=Martelella lutilitoris TaxID=2583532 RepID=A0A7T7HND6_9HYPH|nr:type IV secretory system conjugative DNA transfer family protein [Martelella lutilitoris]QQM32370.1 type IV secretory system conjugative DNA transfer family protein [Martelella lutilitoris]
MSGDDPFADLTKMPVKLGGTEPLRLGDTIRSSQAMVQTATKIGRNLKAASLRRQLLQQGYDPITVDTVVSAVLKGEPYEGIIAAANRTLALLQQQAELLRNPPKIHGSAAWSSGSDLADAGLLNDADETPDGIYFGRDKATGKPIHWNGESHLLTLAPTRTGKGAMQIIPNLLRYRGSAVVLDPKGELVEATGRWRDENVGPVYILNPFEEGKLKTFTDGFNPLDTINNDRDATKLAEMIYPRQQDDKQPFFANEAIGFLAGALLYYAHYADPAERNIGALRDRVSGYDRDFTSLLKDMRGTDDPFIRNAAKAVESKTRDVGIPRLIESIGQHMSIWDTKGLRRATARSDFLFEGLKERNITVYLVLPFDAIGPYSTFVQMVFANALDAMLRNKTKPDIPVLFLLDEFLMLDASDRFVSALRTHAGAGVRLWFFLQDMATLKQKYPTNWQSFMQAEAKSFFGTDDHETSQYISDHLGKDTKALLMPGSVGTSLGGGSASYSINEALSLHGRELMTPQEVETFMASHNPAKPRNALHFFRGGLRVKADLIPWHLDPIASKRCGLTWNRK